MTIKELYDGQLHSLCGIKFTIKKQHPADDSKKKVIYKFADKLEFTNIDGTEEPTLYVECLSHPDIEPFPIYGDSLNENFFLFKMADRMEVYQEEEVSGQ